MSPILSNILLHKLDRFVETTLIPQYTKGRRRKPNKAYEKLKVQARQMRLKGQMEAARTYRQQAQQLPSIETHDPEYRRLRYCRYADDVRHLTHNKILLAEKGGSEESDLRVISPT